MNQAAAKSKSSVENIELHHEARREGHRVLKIFAGIAVIGMIFGSVMLFQHQQVIYAMEVLRAKGLYGAAVFVLIYILSCIVLMPVSVLTPAMGLLYGFFQGVALVSLGSNIGALMAFLIGRYLLRARVERWAEHDPRAHSLQEAIRKRGWKVVLLARLCLFVPFRLSNYAFSTTRISTPSYVGATFLGTLPTICFYVYSGTLLASLADLGKEEDPINWYFHGPAFLVGVVILIVAARFIKKALFQDIETGLEAH